MNSAWLSQILESMGRPLKWWVVVAAWEQGVRIRLGKNPKRLDSGIHFRLPFLDRIYVMPTRTRVVAAEGQTASTRDGKHVTFSMAIRYEIQDVLQMYHATSSVESVLCFTAVAAVVQMLTGRALSEVQPADLITSMNDALQPAAQGMGIAKVEATITTFCTARCYRLLQGGFIPTYNPLDDEHTSGERK